MSKYSTWDLYVKNLKINLFFLFLNSNKKKISTR